MNNEYRNLSDADFREVMCKHMVKQTEFLGGIFEAMKAIRIVGKFLAILGTTGSAIMAIWGAYKALKGQ